MRTQLPAAPSPPPGFAPVVITDAALPAARRVGRTKRDCAADGALIEIVVSGTLIRIRASVDGETLKTVLLAVKGAT
jgi:hypothetical protein